jgi:hypothetical protein
MPHMFRVTFVTNHVNSMVETGKVLVLAEGHEQALDIVCRQLNLPPSRTRALDSQKIKPPCYTVETSQNYPTTKVSMRSQRDAPLAPTQRFHIVVDASTHGQSEQQVLRKIGEELQARGAQTRLRHNIPMKIECETVTPSSGPPSALEKIEMFQPRDRVQGGPVRSK